MSARKSDVRGKKALGIFLDKYLYAELSRQSHVSFERNHEISLQKDGIDVVMATNKGTFYIAEKAQLYTNGNPIPSYVMEVNYINPENGQLIEGQFLSESNKTDYYVFCWINKASTNLLHRIVAEDYQEVEVFFVNKAKVQKYFISQNLSLSRIRAIADRIRNRDTSDMSVKGKGFYFSYTIDKEELPINIVLEKELLCSLASAKYFVTKNEIKSMK